MINTFVLYPLVAERVASYGSITIEEKTFTVSLKVISNVVQDDPLRTIKVIGLMTKLDAESCVDLFENKKKTDGGPIERATLTDDKCSAIIVFKHKEGKPLIHNQYN